MNKIYFVSGIDTDIGKTAVTGMLCRYLRQHGVNAITLKMVQTGNVGFSEDIAAHREIMGETFPEDRELLTAPQIFKFPASPHFAAQREGKTIDFAAIDRAVAQLSARYEVVLIEGAGGLAVPLTPEIMAVDFAAERHWPLLLVTSGRLGSLNHTVMSIEYAKNHGLALAGVIYNYSKAADPEIEADTEKMIHYYLQQYGCPDRVARAPQLPGLNADFAALFAEAK